LLGLAACKLPRALGLEIPAKLLAHALYVFHLHGAWRWVYVATALAAQADLSYASARLSAFGAKRTCISFDFADVGRE
jgi:hypothetical protein